MKTMAYLVILFAAVWWWIGAIMLLSVVSVWACLRAMREEDKQQDPKWNGTGEVKPYMKAIRDNLEKEKLKNTVRDRSGLEGDADYREEEPMNQTTGLAYVVINVRTSDEVLAEEFFKSRLNDPTDPGTVEFIKDALQANYWIIDSDGNLRAEMSYEKPFIKLEAGTELIHVSVTRAQRIRLASAIKRVTGK